MPRMLREIVREVAAQDPGLEVVAEIGQEATGTAATYDPEVIVVGAGVFTAAGIQTLLAARPRTRVLTVDDEGESMLYRLAPEQVKLGELSPALLLTALHG